VKSAQSPKDKFEKLCTVEADISGAPYTSLSTATGPTSYRREYTVILLVGLTELKAQASWIDSETVRAHITHPTRTRLSHPISIYVNLGNREKVCSDAFRVSPP